MAKLIFIYLYGVLSAASLSKMIPLREQIGALAGAHANSFGILISLIAVPPALLGTLSGGLIDRIGARPALISAALAGAAANALYFIAPGMNDFLLIRVLEGFAPLGIYAAAPALMVSTSPPERRNAAMALWSTYTPVGTSLGLLIAAFSLSGEHWRNCFAVHGSLFLAVALLGVLVLPKPAARSANRAVGKPQILAFLATPEGVRAGRLAISFGLMIVLGLGLSVVFPSYFARIHGLSVGVAARDLAAANIVMIIGGTLSGILLSHGGRPASLLLAFGLIGSIAGSGIFFPGFGTGMALTALVLWQICSGVSMAVIASLIPRVAPVSRSASVAGLLSQTGAITTFIAPSLWLAALARPEWWMFVAIIALGWLCCFLVLPRSSET
jgi:predicted MFS family arabinose efflux permease